jgi:membrane protease YdiL (CAAX protease family)
MNDTDPQRTEKPEPPAEKLAAGCSQLEHPAENLLPHIDAVSPTPGQELAVDLRTPLGWLDLVFLGIFYVVSGAVFYLLISTGASLAFGISPLAPDGSVAIKPVVLIVSQALLSGATLLFLFVLLRGRSGDPFWPAMGWRHFRNRSSSASTAAQYAFGGFALALLVGLVSRYIGEESGLPMEEMFRNRPSVLLMMALGILVAPLVEETIFRGCIYPVIARKFGLRASVLATGILFGLAHAQQLWGGWGQIALLICVGIVLTYVRAEAGTVAAGYFVHLGYNTTLFAGYFFATSGLRHITS